MTQTIHDCLREIDADARDLVRDLDGFMPVDALKALRVVQRVADIRKALGVPEEKQAA